MLPEFNSAIVPCPFIVSLNTTVTEAIAQMSGVSQSGQAKTAHDSHLRHPSSYVLVAENGQVVGIFTERDIVRLVAQRQSLDQLVMQQVMSHPVITLRESDLTDLSLALQLLQQHNIRYLPIVDEQDHPLGVVTHASLGQLYQTIGDRADTSSLSTHRQVAAQLEAQNALLARIARSEPLPDILNALIGQVEQQLHQAFCSILLIDEEQRLRHGAAQRLPDSYIQAVDGIAIGEGVGSCGTAAFRQQTVIVSDIASDRLWANYKNLALSHGLRACWSTPIVTSDGQVLGTFAVYYPEVRSPQPDELEAVAQIANIAGIAIERQRAETALRTSEAQYRQIVETANEGIWIIDGEGKTTFVNPKMAEMLGYQPDEMLGQPLFSFMNEEGRELATRNMERRSQGIEEQHDFRFQTKTGEDLWALLATNPLYDDAGTYIGALAMLTDISERVRIEEERKRTEEALRKSESHQRALIQAIPDLILRANRAGIYLEFVATPHFCVVGNLENLIGTYISESLPADIAQKRLDFIQLALQTKLVQVYEQNLSIGGKTQIEEVRVVPYSDDEVLILVRDISDRKRAEIALQQLNEELEQRVQQRTQELIQSEQDLRTIFNNVYDAIFIHDLDGTVLDVNDRALELHQATREQLLGATIADLSAPDAPLHDLTTLFQRVQAGETMRFEWKDRRLSDNTIFDAEVSLQRVQIGNRAVVIAGVRDISERKRIETDRKQAEQNLRESQQFIQTVIDTIPLSMFWKNRDSVFLGCNQQLANVMKLKSTSEIIGKTNFDFSPTLDEATAYRVDDQQVMESGVAKLGIEETFTLPDGRQQWIETHKAPLRDWAGKVVGIVGMFRDITDRKHAEQALFESEQRYATLAAAAPVGIYRTNENGECLYVNEQWCQIAGLTVEEAQGMGWLRAMHPGDREMIAQAWNHFVETGETFQLEYRFQRPDGIATWVYGQAIHVVDENGNLKGCVGTITDISERKRIEDERKQTERALQESEERFRQLAENVDQLFWLTDLQSRLLYISPAFEQIWKRPSSYLFHPDVSLFDTIHPDDRDRVKEAMKKKLQHAYDVEYRIVRPDHEVRWIRDRAFLIHNKAGEVYRIGGIAEDITVEKHLEESRKQVEAQLREQEQFLRSIYEGVNQPIFVADVLPDNQLRYVGWNPSAAHFAGRSSEDIAGKSVEEIFEAGDVAEISQRYLQCIAARQPLTFEECITFHGQTRWMLSTYNPLIDHEGRVYRVVGTGYDITERKKVELALRESEERFRTIFEATSNPIQGYDKDRRVIFWNRASELLYGYTRNDAIGKRVEELIIPEELRSQILSIVNDWIAGVGDPLPDGELQLRNKQGEMIDVYSSHLMLNNVNGDREMYCIDTDLRERKRTEEQIRASLAEKNVLLQEIHHRVKNNLQMVSSLLRLQASTVKDPDVLALLQESQNRVRSMALIHEKLYQSPNLARIDFAEYVKDLTQHLTKTYITRAGNIRITVEVDSIEIDIQVANPLGLILNELLTNALKYAFPNQQAGIITIQFCANAPNQYCLKLSDNGVGLPEGLDISATPSLGLKLVQILTKQLKGTLEVSREQGTCFALTFADS